MTVKARKLLGRLLDIPRSYGLVGSVDAVIVPGMGVLEDDARRTALGLARCWLFVAAAACRLRKRRFVLLDVGAELGRESDHPVAQCRHRPPSHPRQLPRPRVGGGDGAGRAREPEAIAPDLAFAHPRSDVWRHPEPGRFVVGVMAYYGRA